MEWSTSGYCVCVCVCALSSPFCSEKNRSASDSYFVGSKTTNSGNINWNHETLVPLHEILSACCCFSVSLHNTEIENYDFKYNENNVEL